MFIAGVKKDVFRAKGFAKTFSILLGVVLVVYAVVGGLAQLGVYTLPANVGVFFLSASVPSGTGGGINCPTGTYLSNGMCVSSGGGQNYQPTASYSTTNHFSSASVSGTSYYKAGNNKATTTAITNTDPTISYQYWVDNSTYYIKPFSFIGSGTKAIGNNEAYKNGSLTINGYDLINDRAVTSGAYNTSLATGTAKIKYTVLGSATTTAMPFGGVLVVEANSTIQQINCFGDGISSTPSTKYQVTYSPTTTTSRYVIYEVSPGYDVSPDGLIGTTKTFECDFTSSTDPGANSLYYVKMIPANYYYVNSDGSFALDVEQKLNGLTTRTGAGQPRSTFIWG